MGEAEAFYIKAFSIGAYIKSLKRHVLKNVAHVFRRACLERVAFAYLRKMSYSAFSLWLKFSNVRKLGWVVV